MGTLWHRSGTIERYADDIRAAGARAYFFHGGTTSPMTVYTDAGESAAHPHPVVADANGRWPDIFIPYTTSYDVQVKTAEGVQLTYSLEVPNPNPVDVTVDIPVEKQVQTGMIHAELLNTTKAGYVRLNGRSIGNASSSATERANVDTSALFTYLWNNLSDSIAPVSGGRGGSASADFAANKNITLPDMRGRVFIGLDDMGNSAAGEFAGLLSGDEIIPGSVVGDNGITLATGQLPAHTHSSSGVTSTENGTHDHAYSLPAANFVEVQAGSGQQVVASLANNAALTGTQNGTHTHTYPSTTSSVGNGDMINNLPLSRLITWFIKL